MKRNGWLVALLLLVGLSSGCVTRRYLITSDPPGALVIQDGQPIGPTPVERPFLFYGKYRFQLVKDGYQTLDAQPNLSAPWYQWPGIDFFSETIIPYTFRDRQCFHYKLEPLQPVRPDDLKARATELRKRGEAIRPPEALGPPGTALPPGALPPATLLPPGAVPPGGSVVPGPPPPPPAPTPVLPPGPAPAPAPAPGPTGPVGAGPTSPPSSSGAPWGPAPSSPVPSVSARPS